MDNSTGYKINEFLLAGIIVIQFFDFLKILPPFWDYINKIINWILIGILLYVASPSDIFFGERKKWWDATVIIACFGMVLKNIISFAMTAQREMLENVVNFVAFSPTAEAVRSAVVIPVSEATLNTFTIIGGYLPNASMYAKPFASQITITNPAIGFTLQAGNETAHALLQPYGLDGLTFQFYNTVVNNAAEIQEIGFVLGIVALTVLGIIAALRFNVHEKSALSILHESGQLKDAKHMLIRIFAVLFVVIAYFCIIFNIGVEWLAMAVDAPLAMVGVMVIAIMMLRSRHHEADEETVIDKMGNFGNDFMTGFGKLFDEKRTVLFGLSGLLVLHLLTDVGNFVIPYVTGLVDQLYFSHLGSSHETLFALVKASWTGSAGTNAALVTLYALNAIGIIVLLTLPAYIWYKAFKIRTRQSDEAEHLHHPNLPGWLISACLASMASLVVAPVFRFVCVKDEALVGVDLQTHVIATGNPVVAAAILAGIFILLIIMTSLPLKKYLMAFLFVSDIGFFGYYMTLFFFGTFQYYLREVIGLLQQATLMTMFLGFVLFTFLVINLLFYVFGFFSFAYEAARE